LSSSAVEGIEWAESERFDAVLTDMNLPGLDGLEAVKAIARAVPPIPIIAMSGGSASQTVDDYSVLALRFGARRFLQKPFDREHLLAALKDIIDPEPA
jgi:CheY-like chemotaxis protein